MALLVHPATEPPADAEVPLASDAWLDSFSLRAYKPMLRLASREDGHHLKSADLKRYRRMQRALLREYLRSLSRDFQRLLAIASEKNQRVQNGDGNHSMALFEQQIGFIFHVWSVEARLLLRTLVPHSIDLKPLLANVENLAEDTRERIRRPLRFRTRSTSA